MGARAPRGAAAAAAALVARRAHAAAPVPLNVAAPGPRVARSLGFRNLRGVEQGGHRERLDLPVPLLVLKSRAVAQVRDTRHSRSSSSRPAGSFEPERTKKNKKREMHTPEDSYSHQRRVSARMGRQTVTPAKDTGYHLHDHSILRLDPNPQNWIQILRIATIRKNGVREVLSDQAFLLAYTQRPIFAPPILRLTENSLSAQRPA